MWVGAAAALAPDLTAATPGAGTGTAAPPPYRIEREVEDLDAIVRSVGGGAYVHGSSSGATLALLGASIGVAVRGLSVFEPPFRVPGARPVPDGYVDRLVEMTGRGRRGEAVSYFMTEVVGLSQETVEDVRRSSEWPDLEAMAHTLVHDATIMGDGAVPVELLSSLPLPVLVLDSSASPAWLRDAAAATAQALPDAWHRSLPGTFHNVAPQTLAAALVDFFLQPRAGTAEA
ncbi:alpha/beta fold hydrolase [Nocardiopsis ansamitocini]|uniref:alpha/beta fold hydrolase n=1 Tax=Nocardiopsis ansamitocini TaxID=1670832 RepID=UPI00255226DC|nr:alpha/beta fold hydrolase [Nocardiopsis ansamitocini]